MTDWASDTSGMAPRKILAMLAASAIGALMPGAPAMAQRAIHEVAIAAGDGGQIGQGAGNTQVMPGRVYLEVRLHRSTDEERTWAWGGALRSELQQRASVGIVPDIELRRQVGGLELRPGIGAPLFVAPFTLVGAEARLHLRQELADDYGLVASVAFAVFFAGNDLPRDSVLLALHGGIGVEMEL